jgi:succinyl-diaminopimelate desuccinylase
MTDNSRLSDRVASLENEMVRALSQMISIPAVSPESGGEGEYDRGEFLVSLLKENGMTKITRFDARDGKAKHGVRPNIVASIGDSSRNCLWVISHMDTVPVGDIKLWKHDPFDATVRDGKLYGRGAEDNGQSLIASLYAAKAVVDSGLSPPVKIAFVSDEELGSRKGIEHMARKNAFRRGDEFLVPDAGSEKGDEIEIAEKSSLWARVRTTGKQTHASVPTGGINANLVASRFLSFTTDYLYSKYNARDELFKPLPYSTFEPTKRLSNVENVNTIPGTDEFYFDCRILPSYRVSSVLGDMRRIASIFSEQTGAKIAVDVFKKSTAAPPSSPEEGIFRKIHQTVRELRKVEPRFVGIGGGTCANIVRVRGFNAAVWSTECGMAHQPNEFSLIRNMVEDAKVMASLFTL